MKPHDPYVQPFADATQSYIARCDCGCGLFEERALADDAQAVVDAAREVQPDVD